MQGEYELFGAFISRKYTPLEFNISKFRRWFYNTLIENYGLTSDDISKQKHTVTDLNDKTKQLEYIMVINKNNQEQLYSVPIWYYGVKVWNPHLSLFNINDIDKSKHKIDDKELLKIFLSSTDTLQNKSLAISKIPHYDIGRIELSINFFDKLLTDTLRTKFEDFDLEKNIFPNRKINSYTSRSSIKLR